MKRENNVNTERVVKRKKIKVFENDKFRLKHKIFLIINYMPIISGS